MVGIQWRDRVPIGSHPAWLLEESEPIPEFLRREPNNPVWQKVA